LWIEASRYLVELPQLTALKLHQKYFMLGDESCSPRSEQNMVLLLQAAVEEEEAGQHFPPVEEPKEEGQYLL